MNLPNLEELSFLIEVDTDEFTKSGGVVISDCLGVAVRLQNGVGVDNTILQVGFLLSLGFTSFLLNLGCTEDGKVGDDLLGVLSLSGPRLSSNQHRLVPGLVHHALVGSLGDGEEMGRDLIPPLSDVKLDYPVGVDGVALVGVDDNAE